MSSEEHPEIEIGVLTRPHGVRGAVLLRLHNPGSDALQRAGEISVRGAQLRQQVRFKLNGLGKGGVLILILDGVESREDAEALRGATVWVARDLVAPTDEDEYLFEDLVGCRVVDESGEPLGEVTDVRDHGAAPLLILRRDDNELMIPLADEWIEEIDLEEKLIRVTDGDQWRAFATTA